MNSCRFFAILACLMAAGVFNSGLAAGQPPTPPQMQPAPMSLEDRFKQMDKNGDGVITSDESPSPVMFQRMDANGDGKVTLEEFKAMVQTMRMRTAPPQQDSAAAEARFKALDKNKDGVLTPDESPDPSMFQRMDSNGDGKVTLDEFKAAAQRMRAPQGQPSIDARFKALDKNGDGVLTPDEYPNAQAFQQIDKNHDGKLTLDEVRAFAAAATGAPKEPDRQAIEQAQKTAAAEASMRIDRNIRYAEGPGTDQKLNDLDIYAPKKEAANRPVLVFVHGSDWRQGDKKSVGAKAVYFTANNFIFVSINYRLSPAVIHPAHVQDVAAALAWVQANIKKYGGNPDAIFLMGHSAGAQLACLVAMDEKYLKAKGAALSLIKGAVLLDCPVLIFDKEKFPEIKDSVKDVFGTDEAVMKDAVPLEHLAKGKAIPPMMFVAASDIGWNQAKVEQAVLTMRTAGVRAELIDARTFRDHMAINGELGTPSDPASQFVLDFLRSLQPGAPRTTSLGTTKVLGKANPVDPAAVPPGTAPAAKPSPTPSQVNPAVMKQAFESNDANHDGKLSLDEAPPWLKPHFGMADTNKDGFLDYDEFQNVVQQMIQMRAQAK